MAIASLVLGILGLVLGVLTGGLLGVILGLIGLILGIIAVRKAASKGVAIAGIVCSAIALIVGAIFLFVIGAATVSLLNDPDAMQQLQDALQSIAPTVNP